MIPTFIPKNHRLHNPPFEYENGQPVPYRECPQRIEIIEKALLQAGLIEPIYDFPLASESELAQVHAAHYLQFLTQAHVGLTSAASYRYAEIILPDAAQKMPIQDSVGRMGVFAFDVYSPLGVSTWAAAVESASAALAAARALLGGTRQAYALCRPPGHHAGRQRFGSYCYLNNAALAAVTLLNGSQRCAVLDIDYHHGNGTQEIFWDNPNVLYVSLHIDPAFDYPFMSGYAQEIGGPRARGTNCNFPLPPGSNATTYLSTLVQALEYILAFNPDHLILSLGFDAVQSDPFSSFTLSIPTFAEIGRCIGQLNKPTLLVQEGGYGLEDLGALAIQFLNGFSQGVAKY